MTEDTRPEPSPSYIQVTKDVDGTEFTAAFYPGFAREIAVNGETLYDQETDGPNPFVLPSGADKPWSSSAVQLSSSDRGYVVMLQIDDPEHVVDHIEIVLRDPKARKRSDKKVVGFEAVGDRFTINNTPVICPPFC
jgi:hypothetical protein